MSDSRTLIARGCGGVLCIIALSEFFADMQGTGMRPGLWMLIAGLALAFLTLRIPEPSPPSDETEDAG